MKESKCLSDYGIYGAPALPDCEALFCFPGEKNVPGTVGDYPAKTG